MFGYIFLQTRGQWTKDIPKFFSVYNSLNRNKYRPKAIGAPRLQLQLMSRSLSSFESSIEQKKNTKVFRYDKRDCSSQTTGLLTGHSEFRRIFELSKVLAPLAVYIIGVGVITVFVARITMMNGESSIQLSYIFQVYTFSIILCKKRCKRVMLNETLQTVFDRILKIVFFFFFFVSNIYSTNRMYRSESRNKVTRVYASHIGAYCRASITTWYSIDLRPLKMGSNYLF